MLQPHKGSAVTIVIDGTSSGHGKLQPHKGSAVTIEQIKQMLTSGDASTPQGFGCNSR